MLRATTACTFSTSQLPKVVRTPKILYILTSKCTSRHNGVHFFNISTSKSGPNPSVFNTFYFQICFAPQRRTTFHLSSPQMSPHPPLSRAYFSALRSHNTTKKYSVLIFSLLTLLPADCFFISPDYRKFNFQISFDYFYLIIFISYYLFILFLFI